jgi:Ti-type conjugative transfer relaxase TraA
MIRENVLDALYALQELQSVGCLQWFRMPIWFAHTEVIHAAEDSSASGISAYICRGVRTNKVTGARYNFSHKASDLVHHEIMLPKGAPTRFQDAATLWDEATLKEITINRRTRRARFKKNAQVAKHVVLALPKELDDAGRLELTRLFVYENFTKFGVAVEFAIHRPDPNSPDNHHAHLLVTTRLVRKDGFGSKARALNPGFSTGAKGKRFVSEADHISDRWAGLQNQFFADRGLTLRVDPKRSVPSLHLGPTWHAEDSEKREKKAETDEAAALAMQNPVKVLEGITVNKSTFTARDLQKFVGAHGVRGQERDAAVQAALAHPDIVRLQDGRRRELYTTKAVRAQEYQTLRDAYRVKAAGPLLTTDAIRAVAARHSLDAEQAKALQHLASAPGLRIMIGRAGTGKTRTLSATRDVYLSSGYSVHALAPTNTAALNLKGEGFDSASTLHRALYLLKKRKIRWDARTAIFVDEAGMIDTEIFAQLLAAAADAGATVIMAGDDRQLSSVRRGGLFTELASRFKAVELQNVRRQQVDWQRAASQDFARGHIDKGLRAYSERGHVLWQPTLDESRVQLLADWSKSDGSVNQFIYTSTNAEVNRINSLAQAVRLQRGEITAGTVLQSDRGPAALSAGDRLQFYANDRPAGIVNGIVGTVRSIEAHRVEVTTDFGATVVFDPQKFTAWGLGYCGTVYRSQGRTQLRVLALFDNPFAWNAKSAYVAMTRHQAEVKLYASQDIALDEPTLARLMSRVSNDAASIAHPILQPAKEPLAQSSALAALREMMSDVEMPTPAHSRSADPAAPSKTKRKRRKAPSPSLTPAPRRSPR